MLIIRKPKIFPRQPGNLKSHEEALQDLLNKYLFVCLRHDHDTSVWKELIISGSKKGTVELLSTIPRPEVNQHLHFGLCSYKSRRGDKRRQINSMGGVNVSNRKSTPSMNRITGENDLKHSTI